MSLPPIATTVPGWPIAPGTRSVGEPMVTSGGAGASLIHQARYSKLIQYLPSRPHTPLPLPLPPQPFAPQLPSRRPAGTVVTVPVLPVASVVTGAACLATSAGRADPSRAVDW